MRTTPIHWIFIGAMLLGSGCLIQAKETCEQICECSEEEDCVEQCKTWYTKLNCGQGTNDSCREAKDDLADCIAEEGCGGCSDEALEEEEACDCGHM